MCHTSPADTFRHSPPSSRREFLMVDTPLTLTNARVVTPSGVHEGWLRVEGGRVAALGADRQVPGHTHDIGGRWVVPGLVDSHIHGGVGHGFPDADIEGARKTIAFNRARGVTSLDRKSTRLNSSHVSISYADF